MENTNPFTVDEVARRIAATHEELQTLETALATLPARKEALLSAETFEEAALSHLEEEESSLIRKREYLNRRLPVLEKQRETEEAKAAKERITAGLVPESRALRERYDAALATFWKNATALENAANKLTDIYHEMQMRHDEQEWLIARYEAFGLERVPLTDVGEVPNHEDVAKQIFHAIRRLRLTWESNRASSPWGQKLADWQKQQQPKIDTWKPSPVRNVA